MLKQIRQVIAKRKRCHGAGAEASGINWLQRKTWQSMVMGQVMIVDNSKKAQWSFRKASAFHQEGWDKDLLSYSYLASPIPRSLYARRKHTFESD